MLFEISCHLKFHVNWDYMSFDISCNLRFNVIEISYHLRFSVIWYFVSFYISCQLTFRVIWHFVSFISLWQLTFPVIWQFVSFVISFDLGNLSHYSNHSHQSHLGINPSCYRGPVCAQKVGCCIVIGRYGYKSSFGAKNIADQKHLFAQMIFNFTAQLCQENGFLKMSILQLFNNIRYITNNVYSMY